MSRLDTLMKTTRSDEIIALFNAWCMQQYGATFIPCNISLPVSALPEEIAEIDDPDEFFQWITDSLKISI